MTPRRCAPINMPPEQKKHRRSRSLRTQSRWIDDENPRTLRRQRQIDHFSAHARTRERHPACPNPDGAECDSDPRGRPCRHPKGVVADNDYTSHAFRRYLRRKHIRYTIPHYQNEHRQGNIVQRLINRLKQFRRIATRYEKRATNFAAMITFASLYLF